MTEADVIKRLRAEIVRVGSQKAIAMLYQVTDSYISDVLNGRRDIGPAILAGLGLERVVTYRERQGA